MPVRWWRARSRWRRRALAARSRCAWQPPPQPVNPTKPQKPRPVECLSAGGAPGHAGGGEPWRRPRAARGGRSPTPNFHITLNPDTLNPVRCLSAGGAPGRAGGGELWRRARAARWQPPPQPVNPTKPQKPRPVGCLSAGGAPGHAGGGELWRRVCAARGGRSPNPYFFPKTLKPYMYEVHARRWRARSRWWRRALVARSRCAWRPQPRSCCRAWWWCAPRSPGRPSNAPTAPSQLAVCHILLVVLMLGVLMLGVQPLRRLVHQSLHGGTKLPGVWVHLLLSVHLGIA